MNPTASVALIVDTFREALARKIFWGLFGLSTLMILFFLFIMKIDVVEGATATMSLFGRTNGRSVDVNQMITNVFGGIATFLYTWGMFLAVFASAGLIPSVLEPGRIELILSKPVSRVHILLGRYVGNIAVVGCNIAYLVLGVWLILSVKTGIWRPAFLWSIVTTLFVFAVLLTVVVLVGVLFESTALSTMVTVGIMILSPILAQTSTMMKLLSSETYRNIWRFFYNVLPKVYDMGSMTLSIVKQQQVTNLAPIWSSALFGVAILGAAIYMFNRRDF
jgi:ABC-2 type transport system permease protein